MGITPKHRKLYLNVIKDAVAEDVVPLLSSNTILLQKRGQAT